MVVVLGEGRGSANGSGVGGGEGSTSGSGVGGREGVVVLEYFKE